jgi:DNA-binding response OmpR family regulator
LTKRKRVLLAEDDTLLLQLFTEFLTEEGFEVVAVADGLDAFEAFVTQGPFDAVVTDCELPGLTGPQLVERLRDQKSGVPALLMSGRLILDAAEQARLGTGPALRKPFGLDVLAQAVRRLLGGLIA